MKTSITIFIFLSFISYSINQVGVTYFLSQRCGGSGTPTSADDCKDDSLSETQKKYGYAKCCLLENKKMENGKTCIAITEKQGKKLGTIVKELEKDYYYYAYDNKDLSIDCKSSYLKAGLILLISFIIF